MIFSKAPDPQMCYYDITYYICWYQWWLKLSFGFKPMAFWLIYCVVCRVSAHMVVVQWCAHTQRNYIVGDTCTICSSNVIEIPIYYFFLTKH